MTDDRLNDTLLEWTGLGYRIIAVMVDYTGVLTAEPRFYELVHDGSVIMRDNTVREMVERWRGPNVSPLVSEERVQRAWWEKRGATYASLVNRKDAIRVTVFRNGGCEVWYWGDNARVVTLEELSDTQVAELVEGLMYGW